MNPKNQKTDESLTARVQLRYRHTTVEAEARMSREDSVYVVRVPNVPELRYVAVHGDTPEQAFARLAEVLDLIHDTAQEDTP